MNNIIKITLNSRIYNLEAILSTCYTLIDRAYFFLDSERNGRNIIISIKIKHKISQEIKQQFKDRFMNELLYNSLRYIVSKNNKKIREYIVGSALYGSSLGLATDSGDLNYKKDPLGIAIPWEEKYGKNKKKKKNAKASKV